jgi:predicted dehydrogenase
MSDIDLERGAAAPTRPRVGFLGVGWIGRHRMKAMMDTGAIEATAIADPSAEAAASAAALAPDAQLVDGLLALLDLDLDGIVIASPSALHAQQAILALQRGVAVFCQKPLGRTAAETAAVVDAARGANRLLTVDLSYRFIDGMKQIRQQVCAGALGRVFAVDLVFHNAYGPDKPWFYDPALAGGGCVMDLGVHLVDLALWVLDFPEVVHVESTLLAGGMPLGGRTSCVEDYATATFSLASGASIRLACSWRLQAGCDADISAAFYGDEGGAALRNLGGSFYDFAADAFVGTQRRPLSRPPEAWGGRAAAQWVEALARGQGFDPEGQRLVDVAQVLDRVYGR